ncbi:FAD-dependent monooxygenase [Microbacterium radiodurans]|uniref:FAD-binding monooxygenase n=1 Tax=Microbacterium radiodurans TaxID=661398 RepID=A0A5J5IRA0_9MICO|nr:FAD-dependent monooxygenase [Microbacterium radiodurans]KAA9085445.1 FAD-binding monooxygenase [Microbacterium radiodurans]
MSNLPPVAEPGPDAAAVHPVVIAGAGPIGLITALGLVHHGIPVIVLEDDAELSRDTKAGTVLTRTLEVLDRYDAVEPVLRDSVRLDEIGDIERATNVARFSVRTEKLVDDTRYPFVVNIPQNSLEASLYATLRERAGAAVRLRHRVEGFSQTDEGVVLQVASPEGAYDLRAQYVLACDGGRSTIRGQLGIAVAGKTLEARYMLVDLRVDLDVDNPRDYPYLAYFSDPDEWMILVRQPHCWRFLFPLAAGEAEPDETQLREKALRFIGDVDDVEVLGTNIYSVHLRIAERWREDRVFLMGDAAHLITPMWALGLNTGVLDASNLPWRLAWVLRGWADPTLLDGYEREQSAVAVRGSAEMAELARAAMEHVDETSATTRADWGYAMTRTLLGVRLDVGGADAWGMSPAGSEPSAVRVGDRIPDLVVFGPDGGRHRLHDLVSDSFVALVFADARRRPALPAEAPGLGCFVVSRWDAPHDSGLRERFLFDPGSLVRERLGVEDDTVVLVRPDGHVAAILPRGSGDPAEVYRSIVRPAGAASRSTGTAHGTR